MSYARRHSTNVCPGNRVRYTLAVGARLGHYTVTAKIGEGGMDI